MTFTHRLLFHFLRFMDDIWPGWGAPGPEPADYLSQDSYTFWMTKENRR